MSSRRQRSVKIVATLGPASNSYEMISKLYHAGADVFRLNMSHGAHDEIKERYEHIRKLEKETGRPIAILADLQGPKLRVGQFEGEAFDLIEGEKFRFDLDDKIGTSTRVQLPHPEIFQALEVGSSLLVNDGKIRLRVEKCDKVSADCIVEVGGEISNRKGVNVPDVVLPLAALSEKDLKDLEFVAELGVDWIALSFVQRPEDMIEARKLVNGRAAVLAKIEKPAAVAALQSIIDVSDGIMVARGDLGVELPVHAVPPIQKRIVRACRAAGKPVIVATQMMESMITSPVPTRAEVSDVAQAIYEGADAVMLSAESAAGDYPIEAVSTMNNVAIEVENDTNYRGIIEASRTPSRNGVADAITVAAREIAETTQVCAIVTFSQSGTTAQLASRERPSVPIIAVTHIKETARKLVLSWGLHCVYVDKTVTRFKEAVLLSIQIAHDHEFGTKEDNIVLTAGVPFNTSGSTNILRVAPLDESKVYGAMLDN